MWIESKNYTCSRQLCARQKDVNAHVLPGRHHSARCARLKFRHLIQPVAYLSFVCLICQNCIPSKLLSSNIIPMLFTLLIGFSNHRSFIVHAVLPGRCKAFTLSFFIFITGAHVYILLPGTHQNTFLEAMYTHRDLKLKPVRE